MNKHTVFFEIFGKKMKYTVHGANSAEQAKQRVKDAIIFHKVENHSEGKDIIDFMDNIMSGKIK